MVPGSQGVGWAAASGGPSARSCAPAGAVLIGDHGLRSPVSARPREAAMVSTAPSAPGPTWRRHAAAFAARVPASCPRGRPRAAVLPLCALRAARGGPHPKTVKPRPHERGEKRPSAPPHVRAEDAGASAQRRAGPCRRWPRLPRPRVEVPLWFASGDGIALARGPDSQKPSTMAHSRDACCSPSLCGLINTVDARLPRVLLSNPTRKSAPTNRRLQRALRSAPPTGRLQRRCRLSLSNFAVRSDWEGTYDIKMARY